MLCSSAKLLALQVAPLARVQHWRTYRRARAQVYKRIIGALASLRARSRAYEPRSARALDYVLYPSFSRPRSPALPRTAGEPRAVRVWCVPRGRAWGAPCSEESSKSEVTFAGRAGLATGILRQNSLANAKTGESTESFTFTFLQRERSNVTFQCNE